MQTSVGDGGGFPIGEFTSEAEGHENYLGTLYNFLGAGDDPPGRVSSISWRIVGLI